MPNDYAILIPDKIRVKSRQAQTNENDKSLLEQRIASTSIAKLCTVSELPEKWDCIPKLQQETKYWRISVKANDFYMASHEAIRKFGTVMNLFSFYNVIRPWKLTDIKWFSVNTENEKSKLIKAEDLYRLEDRLSSNGARFEKNLETVVTPDSTLGHRLNAAYSYINVGKASFSQEEKFINIWIALESLCRTDASQNIISNILEVVPAALCIKYIYSLYANFINDCKRCTADDVFTDTSLADEMPGRREQVKHLVEIMHDEGLYNTLQAKCAVNTLLSVRCEEIHAIAADNKALFAKIKTHHGNVERQLRRLYRLRNEIAHSALNDGIYLVRHIQILHDYVSIFIGEILDCSTTNGNTEMPQILELLKSTYANFCVATTEKQPKVTAALMFPYLQKTGIIDRLE